MGMADNESIHFASIPGVILGKRLIMNVSCMGAWFRIALPTALFAAFLASSIYILNLDLLPGMNLNQKAVRFTDLILTSSAESLSSYNVPALRKSMESYFLNRDIVSVQITDTAGNVLVNLSRSERGVRELPFTGSIVKDGQTLGTLSIVLTNYSARESANRITDLIIESNLDNIWDYNIEALNNSLESFFKDQNIQRIVIRETSGYTLFEREREAADGDGLSVKKTIQRNGIAVGSVEMIFINHAQEEAAASKRTLPGVMAFVTVTLAILMTVVFIFMQGEKSVNFSSSAAICPAPSGTHWSVSASTEEKLKIAIDYIEKNYTRTISREGLASMLDINADNLGRYFKLYTGGKINDLINRLRIEAAARRLLETDNTIVDIAFDVGFENICTFNRVFWNIKRKTPTEYRKKTSKGDFAASDTRIKA